MNIKNIVSGVISNLPPNLIHIGTGYSAVHDFYQDAQWWDIKQIEQWQLLQLKEIIQYAYANTPGYKQLYDEANFLPSDLVSLSDISRIPFTDKSLLRDNIKDFTVASSVSGRQFPCMTGGSTGIPFSFYVDKKNAAAEYGFIYNSWESVGWKESDIGIKLRGAHLGDEDHLAKKIGWHRYALSASFMTDENYQKYIDIIKYTKSSFLHAYPSTLSDLSSLIISHNDEGKLKIDHIFLGSENLYTWQTELIKRAFPNSKIISWYGQSERVIWAPWCEHHEKYHLNPFYGYTEILDGNREVNEGETGELVGTSFWMKATPFIRYRTNDFAEKGPSYCEKCGRNFQLINRIDGRLSEIIIGRNGRRISLTVFAGSIMHGKTFEHIKQFRFIQEKEGELLLAIVPNLGFSETDKIHLNKELSKFLGADFICEIILVNSLNKSKNGKYSYLEQHLRVNRSDILNF